MEFHGVKTQLKVMATLVAVGIIAWTVYQKTAGSKGSSPDTEPWQETYAWGQLQDLYHSCQSYWTLKKAGSDCAIEKVSQSPFSFRLQPNDRASEDGAVEVKIISGGEDTFSATARHENSPVVWTIDADGQTTCSLGSDTACWNVSHRSQKEVMKEVRHVFGDDVPEDTTSIEIKGTQDDSYVEFKSGK